MTLATTSARTYLRRAAAVVCVATAFLGLTAGTADAATSTRKYYWGAIALSLSTGRVGASYNYATKTAGNRAAVKRCGSGDCQVVVSVANGCAALAEASNGNLGWAYARTLSVAERTARSEAGSSRARIVVYVCTARHG